MQDLEVARELDRWLDGGSPVPLLDRLIELGQNGQAATYARLALADEKCRDRSQVEAILEQLASPPEGWTEAVVKFATDPSLEAWEDLMRFTPPEVAYDRIRNTISLLERIGTDPNILFQCATRLGTVPEAIGLAESGAVDPEIVAVRATEAPVAAGLWLGLAAQAALARGDNFGVVRYLREAYAKADPAFPPDASVLEIRRQAGKELQEGCLTRSEPVASDGVIVLPQLERDFNGI